MTISFQVVVGICAMEKKSLSKPMKEILTRIGEFEYIKTVIFPEDVILHVSGYCTIGSSYLFSEYKLLEVARCLVSTSNRKDVMWQTGRALGCC